MSRIQPKPLFSLLHQPLFRWKLKRMRGVHGRTESSATDRGRIILVTSSDSKLATQELRFARANFFGSDYQNVLCITPLVAWNELDDLPANWTPLSYSIEQITRFGFPTLSFTKQVERNKAVVSVLLSIESDPFSELLFVHTQCPQRVAFHQATMYNYTTLLVSPKSTNDLTSSLHNLFATIQTYLPPDKELV